MVRSELVDAMAEEIGDHRVATSTIECFLETIIAQLEAGGRVELRGFGAYSVRSFEARTARNPSSGKSLEVPAKRRVYFKPGKTLAQALVTTGPKR
jgi:integration host factor subunit beta